LIGGTEIESIEDYSGANDNNWEIGHEYFAALSPPVKPAIGAFQGLETKT